MNISKLKNYAPQARLDFVAAVAARAALLGISKDGITAASKNGDVVLIEGREWPAKVGAQRERLSALVRREGFEAVMDRVAYTWFNRFAALRYMELHDYLGHGLRVLSSRDGGSPEILTHAGEVDLPGLDKARVVELRLSGDRDGDLYRMLLVAQCNALNAAMPFLFERIDDESELLLPDNLLRTDSVVAKLVSAIDEEDWAKVEIIGWLYQFFISERKAQVMGSVVKSPDIPAATQLFTPNWIVKFLVQNSVGEAWARTNPTSSLKARLPFRMEPAPQAEETERLLAELFQNRQDEDGGRIAPESIKILDPACGSGHILVEAYDVLKEMYLERGHRPRSIPTLILENNIHGLDIDDRAAQLAGFAMLMKGREDDRGLLSDPPRLNILSIQESRGLDLEECCSHLAPFGATRAALSKLIALFLNAKTIGSLIEIPADLAAELPGLEAAVGKAEASGDLYAQQAAQDCSPLLRQARILASQYDAVIANPPYMGYKGMNPVVKGYLEGHFPEAKADLFAAFMVRCLNATRTGGHTSMITMHSWMFLPSYKDLRPILKRGGMLRVMSHLGARAFDTITGEIVQTTAFIYLKGSFPDCSAKFRRLVSGKSEAEKMRQFLEGGNEYVRAVSSFDAIPDSPLTYWMGPALTAAFSNCSFIEDFAKPRQGMATADNERFLRGWHEVALERISFDSETSAAAEESGCRWFPYNKGGRYRKWFGNNELVVNWENDGKEIKNFCDDRGKQRSAVRNADFYFKPGITWTTTTSNSLAVRYSPPGFLFDVKGSSLFPDPKDIHLLLGFLGSPIANAIMSMLNPTMEFQVGNMAALPLKLAALEPLRPELARVIGACVASAKQDWDEFETSWNFQELSFVSGACKADDLKSSWERWSILADERIKSLSSLETRSNEIFIQAYSLEGELDAEVSEAQITSARADRATDGMRLLSYAIGCMMGRYSLDEPGLIYAGSGGVGFDPERYPSFPADADGILPLTNELWFEDDSTLRMVEFLRAVWGKEASDANMDWLAESLGRKSGETAEETVRSYLSSSFYKDHLQTYKKRPIYWLFSSGKQKAFEALVYLHRYQEGTLARMRSEYVVPLLSKYLDRIELLGRDAEAASSAAARTKIQKRIDTLRKKHHELVVFEEKLRHMADSRISLDLDEGVKANYSKFGDLLAETKAVTGGSED